MRKLVFVLFAFAMAGRCVRASDASPFRLVENGKAAVTIFAPGENEPAGRRLARRLLDWTGVKISVVKDSATVPDGDVIAIGTPATNPLGRECLAKDAPLDPLGDEGYILKLATAGKRHVLVGAGRTLAGTNNAVSELLTWRLRLNPASAKVKDAAVPSDLDISNVPGLKYRIVWTSDGHQNWASTVAEMHKIEPGETGTTVVPYTIDGFRTHFERGIDFLSDHKLNGYIVWGFLRDEHGGIATGREVSHYARQQNVRILPGVCTQAAYGGFIYSQTNPFSLAGWLKQHPELCGQGKNGKPQPEAICPSKPQNQQWLRDGTQWLLTNLPDIGGFNLENGDLQECYTPDCVAEKHKPENDPNFFWDMMATQRPVIETARRLRPDGWYLFATYVDFRERTIRGLKGSPTFPPRFLSQYPLGSICQWTVGPIAFAHDWPDSARPPAARFGENVGLVHQGSIWGAPVDPKRWWAAPGASFDDCSTVIQFACSRAAATGMGGIVLTGQTGAASPANELNFLAFEYFSWHPDRSYDDFLRDHLALCYGDVARAGEFLRLLRNTTRDAAEIQRDEHAARQMSHAIDLDVRQQARWRNLADELLRRTQLLAAKADTPVQHSAAAASVPALAPAPAEYSFAQACKDWPELPTRVTALGATHSPFHAAVYADGTVALAGTGWCPADKWLMAYRQDRLLLSFGFGQEPPFDRRPRRQSLVDGFLPAVITQPSDDVAGVRYEQSTLMHLLGADESQTGLEPSILRTSIDARNPTAQPRQAVVWLELSAMQHKPGVDQKGEWLVFASQQPQPVPYEGGELQVESNRILDADGRLRMVIDAPPGATITLFHRADLTGRSANWSALAEKEPLDNLVRIEFPVAANGSARLRLTAPVVPLDPKSAAALIADPFDAAWNRTLDYWRRKLAPAGERFSVPEPAVMNVVRSYPWQVMTKMDREPATGRIIPKTNALLYEAVWGHITAWECNALDDLGYHDQVEQYLQPFLDWQGNPHTTGKAEGITDWSGFLASSLDYTYWNWSAHHGYLMWELGEHYRLTHDQKWFERVKPKLLKAARWTIQQLDSTKKNDADGQRVLGWGLFPPSISSDLTQHLDNSAFNDAWIYRGLASIGAALHDASDPAAADEIQHRAEAYRQDIRTAWRRAIADCPKQTLADGSTIPFVPGLLHLRDWRNTRGKNMGAGFLVFYLMDTGPLHLGQCGVFGKGDPEMEWALRLIRDGPPDVRFLTHGVSTCEICFAPQFEYYLAHDDDPTRAIEVFYSALAGSMDRSTLSGWEFRGGIQFCPCDAAEIVRQLRLMLIQECPDDVLRLAAATPRAWLADGKEIGVREAPTRFGPLSYRIVSHAAQSRIQADVSLPQRHRPRSVRLRLRHHDAKPIRSVTIDGKADAHFAGEWIDLPIDRPAVRVVASF